jgi:hypothetical protein
MYNAAQRSDNGAANSSCAPARRCGLKNKPHRIAEKENLCYNFPFVRPHLEAVMAGKIGERSVFDGGKGERQFFCLNRS